jgi:hypothetical protein
MECSGYRLAGERLDGGELAWGCFCFHIHLFHLYALMYKPRNATRRKPRKGLRAPEAYVPIGAPRFLRPGRAGKPLVTGAELLR